jgi:hypothetical protein
MPGSSACADELESTLRRLRANDVLTQLNLFGNDLRDEGAAQLAGALRQRTARRARP